MYEPTLQTPLNTDTIPWGYNPYFSPISAATSQANPSQTYIVILNEGSETDRARVTPVGGLVAADNVHATSYESDDTPAVSTLGVATTGFPTTSFMPAFACGLVGGLHCDLPMDGSVECIRTHLRGHGHRHPQRETVQCPWIGCSNTLLWMNIPRHIQSIHLGVRFRCFNCGKLYTRPDGLERHATPLKCNGEERVGLGHGR